MKARIISKSSNWLDTIWAAIRTCKSPKTPEELFESAKDTPYQKKINLVRSCADHGHLSVLEHAFVSFAVDGVSRALLAQITRHRIGVSFCVQSQRSVKVDTLDYVIPHEIAENPEALKEFKNGMKQAEELYKNLIARGIKPEDARMITPGGATCNFVISFNLRSFLDVYHKRVEVPGAQWEIRALMQHMAELIMETEPWTRCLF